jgi:DNA primase
MTTPIDRLKEEIDVGEVLELLGGEVVGRGYDRWVQARCPFHGSDRNPSASIHRGLGRFVCHTCDVRGSIIDLALEHLGTEDVRKAVEWLTSL